MKYLNAGSWKLVVPLLAGSLLVGCAHTTGATAAPAAGTELVVVTGSRIPQRIDPTSEHPATTSPVTVYSRQRLDQTGRDGNLGGALRDLDPSIGTRP